MSAGSYVLGTACLLAFLAAGACTAVVLRRLLVPGWSGAPARLVELVLWHATSLAVALVLGTVGLLSRWPVVLLATALAVVAVAVGRRRTRPDLGGPVVVPRPVEGRLPPALALGAVAVVAAQWLSALPPMASTGMLGFDALHYRLTHAAYFAQSGSTTRLHHAAPIDVQTYYPFNDEVLHALGWVLLGVDAASLVIPLIAVAGVLLATACLGRALGSQALAVLATCVVLAATAGMLSPATTNDLAAAWPLLAAVALLALSGGVRDAPPRLVLLTGLAVGLAVGTKLNQLAPAAGLLLCVLVAAGPGRRLRAGGLLAVGGVLGGGYWFVRNAVLAGNPLPMLRVGIGPYALPSPRMPRLEEISFSVLDYATDASVVREWFVPSLRAFLGPAWAVLLVAVAAGLLAALLRRSSQPSSVAAVVGLATLAGHAVTPTSAGGLPGEPVLFYYNLRYALVGLVLGLVLAATGLPRVRSSWTASALAFAVVVTAARPAAWASGWPTGALLAVTGCAVLLALAVVVGSRSSRRVRRGAGVAAVLLAAAAGLPATQHYLAGRYQGDGDARQRLYASVAGVRGERIGVVGAPLHYPFFGPRLQNEVAYVGRLEPDLTYGDHDDCREFRRATASFDRLVLQPQRGGPPPAALAWTRSDPAAREVFRGTAGSVFVLTGRLDPSTC